ncbi:zf-HC2 domain-containing protein [Mucilaginibacter psychrotolerans]|uniref:Zf-HC2 domain-containing protein n=2 Tax=Mucilaginibacter psychrotolerans TaxID=1524096 RepID=A0A4Y8SDZ5_9SPHI|nr:zf-HC2 domain-containing protein [Mucilaginibacter psychrotolerans]
MNPLKAITRNCRKATFLADKRMDGKLTFRESIELRIHLVGCGACRLYTIQSAKISQMINELLKSQPQDIRLDSSFKANLQERINDEMNKN